MLAERAVTGVTVTEVSVRCSQISVNLAGKVIGEQVYYLIHVR